MLKVLKSIIGMVHVGALPGTPKNREDVESIISKAVFEAKTLEKHGVDAIMIENMHDRPYCNKRVGPEIVSAMTAVACAIRKEVAVPLGVQILAGANKEALSVALVAGFDFIRAEGFVFGHLADEGWIESDAAELLRYRKQIGAEHVKVFVDVKKKHSSHAVTNDVSIEETAKAAEFFLADGLIVTGSSTGQKASIEDVKGVKGAVGIPVLIGSGICETNIHEYWELADGFIVGSALKYNSNWENDVDPDRVKSFVKRVRQLK